MTTDKKCDMCGKKPSTVHLTEVINENVSKMHLCEDCAKKKSQSMQSNFGLTDLLSGLMDFGEGMPTGPDAQSSGPACPFCGMDYLDFQRTGRLGCGRCYRTFEEQLAALLSKIHGSDRHAGKMPYQGEERIKDQRSLRHLKRELELAVRAENFEKAAVLRDQIRQLEEKFV